MTTTSPLYKIALGLTVVGGINWGSIGLFEFNLVTALLGNTPLPRIVYTLVGLSALYVTAVQLQASSLSSRMRIED